MRVDSGQGADFKPQQMAGDRGAARRGRAASAETKAAAGVKAEESTPTGEQSVKERGVIRLLRAGHFKPVAALRHHIKFQNEIAAAGIEPYDVSALEGSDQRGAALPRFIEQYLRLQAASSEEVELPEVDEVLEEAPVSEELPAPGSDAPLSEPEAESPVRLTA